jgi:type VI secretion system protein
MTMLVERLAGTVVGRGEAAERASILAHLSSMLSTRRGTVRARPDYGLPDISDLLHQFPDAILIMRDAIRHTIRKYEPRLANIQVTSIDTPATELAMRFGITASLRGAAVRFETAVKAGRGVSVT